MSIVTEIMDAEAKPEQPAEIPVEELSESELEAQLDELDERAAGAAETIQTLEEIQEIIEQSLSDGGLSDTEVVVAVDSINDAVATSPVELDRVDLPTTESAKTLAERRERTQLVMESIGERIKEVGNKLWEMLMALLERIRQSLTGRKAKVEKTKQLTVAAIQKAEEVVEKAKLGRMKVQRHSIVKPTPDEPSKPVTVEVPDFIHDVIDLCLDASSNSNVTFSELRESLDVIVRRWHTAVDNYRTLKKFIEAGDFYADWPKFKPLEKEDSPTYSFKVRGRRREAVVEMSTDEWVQFAKLIESTLERESKLWPGNPQEYIGLRDRLTQAKSKGELGREITMQFMETLQDHERVFNQLNEYSSGGSWMVMEHSKFINKLMGS